MASLVFEKRKRYDIISLSFFLTSSDHEFDRKAARSLSRGRKRKERGRASLVLPVSVDTITQGFCCLKDGPALGSTGAPLPSLRIASLPRWAFLDRKHAKSAQLNALAMLQGFPHCSAHGMDHNRSFFPREAGIALCECVNQLTFGHRAAIPSLPDKQQSGSGFALSRPSCTSLPPAQEDATTGTRNRSA